MCVNPSTSQNASSTVTTGVLVEERHFTWKIENFLEIHKSDTLVSDQTFKFELGTEIGLPTAWSIRLEPCNEHIGLVLELQDKPNDAESVNFSADIAIKKQTENGFSFEAKTPMDDMLKPFGENGTNIRTWRKMIPKTVKVEELPLVNGGLVLELNFKVFVPKPASFDLDTKIKEFETKSMDQLVRNLAPSPILPDASANRIVQVNTGYYEFNGSVGMIAARSSVFRALLQAVVADKERTPQMGEERTDQLVKKHIKNFMGENISFGTMEVILHYSITGKLAPSWKRNEIIVQLPYAVEKFDLKLFKNFLDDVLGSVVNVTTAEKLLPQVTELGMEKAVRELSDFIKRN